MQKAQGYHLSHWQPWYGPMQVVAAAHSPQHHQPVAGLVKAGLGLQCRQHLYCGWKQQQHITVLCFYMSNHCTVNVLLIMVCTQHKLDWVQHIKQTQAYVWAKDYGRWVKKKRSLHVKDEKCKQRLWFESSCNCKLYISTYHIPKWASLHHDFHITLHTIKDKEWTFCCAFLSSAIITWCSVCRKQHPTDFNIWLLYVYVMCNRISPPCCSALKKEGHTCETCTVWYTRRDYSEWNHSFKKRTTVHLLADIWQNFTLFTIII